MFIISRAQVGSSLGGWWCPVIHKKTKVRASEFIKGRASVLSKRHAYKQSLLAVAVGLNGNGTNMKHTTWHSVCVLLLPKQSANHVTNSVPQAA